VSFLFSKKIFKRIAVLLNKIDTFDALLRFKKEIAYLYATKISVLGSRLRKQKIHKSPEHKLSSHSTTIEDIIRSPQSFSKHLDSQPVVDDEEHKTTMIKKRKLLEKIIYEAL
jgi:hypothetical protein